MNRGYGKLEKAPKPNAASIVQNKKPASEISFARRCSTHSNLFVRLPALAFSSRRLSIHPKLWKFGAELAYYV
jgi:hypothetical protein